MTNSLAWNSSRGLERALLQETVVSDLLQFLSDLDPTPWIKIVGFTPVEIERESQANNSADLILKNDAQQAIIEIKVGHDFDPEQQQRYEALQGDVALFLLALRMDEQRVMSNMTERWRFLSLTTVFDGWLQSKETTARVFAQEISAVLQSWDDRLGAVFQQHDAQPVSGINEKALARVLSRRLAVDLRDRGHLVRAHKSKGGGAPIVEAWAPIRGEGDDRCFIAEVRWRENHPVGELRFGIDLDPRPGCQEDEEVRRAAYDLAVSMERELEVEALQKYLDSVSPRLAKLIQPTSPSRPTANGEWEQVIQHGFANLPNIDNRKPDRRQVWPAFYGDGALRFEAMVTLDFTQLKASEIVELLDTSLAYLLDRQPAKT